MGYDVHITRKENWFDDETGILSIAGAPIVEVQTVGFEFKLRWEDDTWKQWKELTEHSDFRALVQTAEGKLEKAAAKGKGKASRA